MESKYSLSAGDLKLLDSTAEQDMKSPAFFVIETPTVQTEQKKKKRIYKLVKRCADVALSLIALAVLSPVFLITAIAVKLEDGGPVIYKRYCVGAGRKQYVMYKFRSMQTDADDLEKLLSPEQLKEYEKECKLADDPRITKTGKFIRRFSIDELPQLWSVLKGDMSLVGPRPIVEFETSFWDKDIDELLAVTPGITGYWQTHGRADATYESGKRQELEMYYVNHRSLKLDIQILFGTVKAVFGGRGAR